LLTIYDKAGIIKRFC